MNSNKIVYLSYPNAKLIVHQYNLQSRADYYRWWDASKPPWLPRNPHKVYKEWAGWKDFLGYTEDKSFALTYIKRYGEDGRKRKGYRTYWEGVRFAQKVAADNNINTQKQWEKWWDDCGTKPDDIPRAPQLIYPEWSGRGWPVWLGQNIRGKLEMEKNKVAVMVIYNTPPNPMNIVNFTIIKGGVSELIERAKDDRFNVLRAFYWEEERKEDVFNIFKQFASSQADGTYLVANIHELLFELGTELEWVRPQ